MSQASETLPLAPQGWAIFIAAGLLVGLASAPVLHLLNDKYRFEPTGLMHTDPKLIEKERRDRSHGDWLSSTLQGGLLGAIFGIFFAAAEGVRRRSPTRLLMGVIVGGIVGVALGTVGRNLIRDFALYCISNNIRGLTVSAALQGLLWAGPVLGAVVGIWAASGSAREGGKLALAGIVALAAACFVIPMLGQTIFPEDYTDRLPAEHWGQSGLAAGLAGLIVGTGIAFAARPVLKESSA